jgi:integrase
MRTKQTTDQTWQKAGPNLVRYVSSGVYFARVKVRGKLHRQSLETTDKAQALRRLKDLEAKLRNRAKDAFNGKLMFSDVLKELREMGYRSGKTRAGKAPKPLKPRTRAYYEETITSLIKTWRARFGVELESQPLSKITPEDCGRWANTFAPGNHDIAAKHGCRSMSSSVYNHAIGLLWHIFQIGVRKGAILLNPADDLGRASGQEKRIVLPTTEDFHRLVNEIENPASGQRSGFSKPCADLVRFLALSGCRLGEAREVRWQDCNFTLKMVTIWGHPETRTKNGEHRTIPMIPELESLLRQWREDRPDEAPDAKVLEVFEAQKAINRACKVTGIHRLTHHDFRHLFATRALQCGVDVPTVAGWLGHKDKGALILKTYSHVMPEHSADMAVKVSFNSAPADNVVMLQTKEAV